MVKILIATFLVANCFANSALDLATKISGKSRAQIEKFFNSGDYTDEFGNLDISKISQTLKFNSLINLSYKSKVAFDVQFQIKQNSPLLLLKIIKDALVKLGYNDVLTTEFINGDNVALSLNITSKFILDPGVFYSLLKQTKTVVKDVKKTGDFSYFYELDVSHSSAQNTQVDFGENQLSKPLEPYLLLVENFKSATIEADLKDHWTSVVKLLDKNLNLLEEKTSDGLVKSVDIGLTDDTKYIMIDDKNSLENIKHGLKIYLK